MRYLIVIFALLSNSFAHAGFNPNAHKFKCGKVEAVAKEAIAYSLVGAWEPYANHKCFAQEKFEFFRPSLGEAEGDIIDPSKLIQFQRGRDKYAIESVKKNGDEYLIAAKFSIDKKIFSTTYRYVPDADYTGRTGICGFVTNATHKIVRSDCIDHKKRQKLIGKK